MKKIINSTIWANHYNQLIKDNHYIVQALDLVQIF
jgi:hypothetical protein